MVWTDTHAAAWALRERLKSSDLTNYLQNLLRDQAPRFIDGSSHTPVGMVQVLGSIGMKIATLRGRTAVTSDGTNEPRLTVTRSDLTKEVMIDGDTGSVTVTDSYKFAADELVDTPIPLVAVGAAPPGWTSGDAWATPGGPYWTQTLSGNLVVFRVPTLPRGVTITQIHMVLDGNGGGSSHGVLPTLPSVQLIEVSSGARVPTIIGSATDTSASLPVYEALHTVSNTSLSHAYNSTREYFLRLQGESGGGFTANALRLYEMRVSFLSSELKR